MIKSHRIAIIAVIAFSTGLAVAKPVFRLMKDGKSEARIYAFLVKDRQIFDEYFQQLIATKVDDRKGLTLEYTRRPVGQDTSGLPNDFREAWEANEKSVLFHMEAALGSGQAQLDAQAELANEKQGEFLVLEANLRRVADSYGIELRSDNRLAY